MFVYYGCKIGMIPNTLPHNYTFEDPKYVIVVHNVDYGVCTLCASSMYYVDDQSTRYWSFLNFGFGRYRPGNPLLNPIAPVKSASSTNLGIIIGCVLGGILALAIIIFLVVYFVCLRRRPSASKGVQVGGDTEVAALRKAKTLASPGNLILYKSDHTYIGPFSIWVHFLLLDFFNDVGSWWKLKEDFTAFST